jgi:hypothetical protein
MINNEIINVALFNEFDSKLMIGNLLVMIIIIKMILNYLHLLKKYHMHLMIKHLLNH